MAPKNKVASEALSWLLEAESPGVRYLALRDLAGCAPEDAELSAARRAAHERGPIAEVLAAMQPEGYWVAAGPGYNPKYRSTVWAVILLAQLGASAAVDARVAAACAYLLDHALAPGGQFSATGAPSGTADCLQGNLCWALRSLGCDEARLDTAYEWLARSVTGEGVGAVGERGAAVRYYAGKCGPLFACGSNDKKSCAWGAAKVMLALSSWPARRRPALARRAVEAGAGFLLAGDPAEAPYPNGYSAKPSGNWWKFGFPVFYVTDLLQIVEALAALGYARDPRLAHAVELIRAKADARGRWALEYDYAGKTWADFGPKRLPNKWVTLRALRVLNACAG